MADKSFLFIGMLCLCMFLNLFLEKFPVTVTIGSPHGNTTGLQFHLAGIGVPKVHSKGRNPPPPFFVPQRANTSRSENPVVSRWRKEMYCKLKLIPFSTITRNMTDDTNNIVFPTGSLEKLVHFNSCAVVSSSHGLTQHRYGQDIDAHDAVLRFNCAPTDRFEEFVGSRTDIRLINTQIPEKTCKNEFWNDNVPMFNNETVVIRNWEAILLGPHGVDVKGDVFHMFENLKKYRRTYPNRTMPFVQRHEFGPGLRAELGRFCVSTGRCSKTNKTPSTGMLGVVMLLHLCNWVHVYEIVPSNKDKTNLQYYYDEKTKKNKEGWHSYSQEQQYIRTLSLTPDQDMDDTGVVLLKGLDMVQC